MALLQRTSAHARVLFACTLLLVSNVLILQSRADSIPTLSFGDHYDKSDAQGRRLVSPSFTYGGDTAVMKNFIRLTPDRQSKRGYIWSQAPITREKLVAVLTFRIHGQGRRWFGDGLGLWFTTEPQFKNGDNHGFTDKFYGVGVVFDTFHNAEHHGGHKDVTVQINDGTKTLDDLHDAVKIGCDAAIRYHAKSANFDPVFSSSRIRVTIDGTTLKLEIDPQSAGVWENCYAGNLPFPHDWLQRATIGITASTGALADNHDVIQLAAFDSLTDTGVSDADSVTWSHHYSKEFDKMIDQETCDRSCKIGIMLKYVSNFEMEMEHWFEDLKESTENTMSKMNSKQDDNQAKIAQLRLTHLVDTKIDEKMQDTRVQMQEKITLEVENKMVAASTGWRTPFFLFLLVLAMVVGYAYQKYRKLVKSHLM